MLTTKKLCFVIAILVLVFCTKINHVRCTRNLWAVDYTKSRHNDNDNDNRKPSTENGLTSLGDIKLMLRKLGVRLASGPSRGGADYCINREIKHNEKSAWRNEIYIQSHIFEMDSSKVLSTS
ncbi:uncharacterized protein LOC130810552 isoform X2 [Amaranthus tricolor]|uniref:uncharacterized protein LOC130810552 isoform X2 n=1 Tax=Amaranthus tricolor TaxID=29722 RepID=UPI002585AD5D|nr:uncharacterized protein LOC130810552 isoform X2 [Amaranthus tricolor]